MDLTRSASFVFDPASLVEGTDGPLVASFSREGPPSSAGQKSEFSKATATRTRFPITQSARRDLLRFKQFALALAQISASCPEFRTGASISAKNRQFQTVANRVIGEIVVRNPTSLLPVTVSLIEDSAIVENTPGVCRISEQN